MHKIEGDSFEDCKEKLRWQYKGRAEYLLVSRRDIPVGGIRGFFTGETKTEVEYMLVDRAKSRNPQQRTDIDADFKRQKPLIISITGSPVLM